MLHGAPSFGTATALQLRFQHYRLGFIQARETDYNRCFDVINPLNTELNPICQ